MSQFKTKFAQTDDVFDTNLEGSSDLYETGKAVGEETLKDEISKLKLGKAEKADTLAGYGITDAYTKPEVDAKHIDARNYTRTVEVALEAVQEQMGNVYTKAEVDEKLGDIDTAIDNIITEQESIIVIQNALIGGGSV